jgi:hypothetical protein
MVSVHTFSEEEEKLALSDVQSAGTDAAGAIADPTSEAASWRVDAVQRGIE